MGHKDKGVRAWSRVACCKGIQDGANNSCGMEHLLVGESDSVEVRGFHEEHLPLPCCQTCWQAPLHAALSSLTWVSPLHAGNSQMRCLLTRPSPLNPHLTPPHIVGLCVGISQLRCFIEQLLQRHYLDSVPAIVPHLEKERRQVQAQLTALQQELGK